MIDQTTPHCCSSTDRVKQWREWAQFVHLGGGTPEGTDGEIQSRVCASQDQELHDQRNDILMAVNEALEDAGWSIVRSTVNDEDLYTAIKTPTVAAPPF